MSADALAAACRFTGGFDRDIAGLDAVAELKVGKTSVVVEIVQGRVTDAEVTAEPTVTVPLTPTQVAALADGSGSPSEDYMRGDCKPVGSVRAAAAVFAVLERAETRAALATALDAG